jgi:hypothetical protein
MFLVLVLASWIALGRGECTVASCDTKGFLVRVELNCNDRASCLEEMEHQKRAIVPTDGDQVFAERMKKDLGDDFFPRLFGTMSNKEMREFGLLRDAILRIPRDFDSILRVGDDKKDWDGTGDHKHYTGEYTAYRIMAYQSGHRLLMHLKDCYNLCKTAQTNGERFCDDSFGSAMQGVQESVLAVRKQIRPWMFQDSRGLIDEVRWERFSNEKCLGQPASTLPCEEELRERFVTEMADPSKEVLEFATDAIYSDSDSNNRYLKKITYNMRPGMCFFPNSRCLWRESIPGGEESYANLTKKTLRKIKAECSDCWVRCRAKCFHPYPQWYLADQIRAGAGILTWLQGLCVSQECVKELTSAQRNFEAPAPNLRALYHSLDKLDILLGLMVSALSILGCIVLLIYGKAVFLDAKVSLYMVLTVFTWNLVRLVAYSLSFGSKPERVYVHRLLQVAPVILLILQAILFSVLLTQWILALLPSTWNTRKVTISIIIIFVCLNLGFGIFGFVSAILRTLNDSASKFIGARLLVAFLVALVTACCVCCAIGLATLKLEKKEDRNALIKSLVLFGLILFGLLIRSVYTFLVPYRLLGSSGTIIFTINISLGEALISFSTLFLAFLIIRVARMRRFSPIGEQSLEMQERLMPEEVPDAYRV